MFWKSVFHDYIKFALNKREEIFHGSVADIISGRNDEVFRQEFFIVCDLGGIGGIDNNCVRHIVYSAEYHDFARFTSESKLYACRSDSFGLVNIGLREDVRRASLHYVQFNGTNLAADLPAHTFFKIFSDTR